MTSPDAPPPQEPGPAKGAWSVRQRLRDLWAWSGLAPKDVVTITIATCALVVSGYTAYYNLIRVNDDMRLVVQRQPILGWKTKEERAYIAAEPLVAFINYGNRPAVVMSIEAVIHVGRIPANTCDRGSAHHYLTDLEPVVIEPNKIVNKPFKLTLFVSDKTTIVEADGRLSFNVPNPPALLPYSLCLILGLLTPSDSLIEKPVAMGSYNLERATQILHNVKAGPDPTRPIQLLRK